MQYPSFPKDCQSLLSKYCSQELFRDLQFQSSDEDFSFAKAIFPGVKYPYQKIGTFAGGSDSYDKYAPLFNLIIDDLHATKSTDPFINFTLKDVLISGACDYVGSVKDASNRWDYFEQSLIKGVHV